MIQRFCFVKLLDAEAPHRAELAARIRAALGELAVDASVALPADASAARWDLSIVIATATLAAWHALAARPELVALLADLATRAAVVKAWTFEAPDADDA